MFRLRKTIWNIFLRNWNGGRSCTLSYTVSAFKSPKQIVQIIKSITAKKIFQICPEVKENLWGGAFWTSGYFVNTVSRHGNESTITNYVKNQGITDYEIIHKCKQLELFE